MNNNLEQQSPTETMSNRIRLTRNGLEINQRELARRAGISHSLVSVLESGKRTTVSVDAGSNLAKVLGVTLSWLRCEPGAMKDRPDLLNSNHIDMANALKIAAHGMQALQNNVSRHAVLSMFKMMIDAPEKIDSFCEAINAIEAADRTV